MKRLLLILIVMELVFLTGTMLHIEYFNGSPYWQWEWRQLSYLQTGSYLFLPLIPFLYGLWKIEKPSHPSEITQILLILAASNFLFQLMSVASEPLSFEFVKIVVLSRRATSYFYDALQIDDLFSFLANFHRLDLRGHSSVHPPGPILFYYLWIRLFGADGGAYVGGFVVGLIASLGIPVLYIFSSLWTEEPKVRLMACALYSMAPGFVLFFPSFDQVYPVLSMLMIYFWESCLRRSRSFAVYLGLAAFAAAFFAYNLLAIGIFHLLSAIVFISGGLGVGERLRIVGSAALVAISTTLLCYGILFLLTGFDPVLSLARAYGEFRGMHEILIRPYGFYVFYNFYEFFLGSGIIQVPLLITFVAETIRTVRKGERSTTLAYIGFGTIVLIDLIGLLRSETTRLWLFLQPLILIPVGFQLVRLSPPARLIIFLLLWLNVVVIKSNMWFLRP